MNDTLVKIANEAERVQLSDQTAKTLDTFDKAIDQVLGESLAQIKRTREMCDTVEAALISRHNMVKDAMKGFIGSIQVTANVTDDAQKAIGDVLVQADQL